MAEKAKTISVMQQYNSPKKAAELFYRIVDAAYGLELTDLELKLLAHTALWGTITTPPAKDRFVEEHKTSKAVINNMLSKLQKQGLLVKDEMKKIRLHPKLRVKFEGDNYEFKVGVAVKKKEEAGEQH